MGIAPRAAERGQESFLEEGCPEPTLGGGQACTWPKESGTPQTSAGMCWAKRGVRDSPGPRWTAALHTAGQASPNMESLCL